MTWCSRGPPRTVKLGPRRSRCPDRADPKMAPRMPRVYLIRHGETEWSLNGRHTGTSDIPLTENGVRLIENMRERVIGPDRLINPEHLRHIIISPRQRAQKTAELLFGKDTFAHIHVTTDESVAEWDYGAYEGLKTSEIKKLNPDWSIWRDGCPPGENHPGESVQQMTDRVDGVIARVRDIHRKAEQSCTNRDDVEYSDVIIFSHGHFSRVFIARWCGFPLSAGYNFQADAGGVNILGYQHMSLEEPSLLALNWYVEHGMHKK